MIESSEAGSEQADHHEQPAAPNRRRAGYAGFTVVFVLAAVLMMALTVCGGLALAIWLAAG